MPNNLSYFNPQVNNDRKRVILRYAQQKKYFATIFTLPEIRENNKAPVNSFREGKITLNSQTASSEKAEAV